MKLYTTFSVKLNEIPKEEMLHGDFSSRLADDLISIFSDSGYEVSEIGDDDFELGEVVDNGRGELDVYYDLILKDEVAERYFRMEFATFPGKENAELCLSEMNYHKIYSEDFDEKDCQFIEFTTTPGSGGSAWAVDFKYNDDDTIGDFIGKVLDADAMFLDQWFKNDGYIKGRILKKY